MHLHNIKTNSPSIYAYIGRTKIRTQILPPFYSTHIVLHFLINYFCLKKHLILSINTSRKIFFRNNILESINWLNPSDIYIKYNKKYWKWLAMSTNNKMTRHIYTRPVYVYLTSKNHVRDIDSLWLLTGIGPVVYLNNSCFSLENNSLEKKESAK